jgi:hypothetical protein
MDRVPSPRLRNPALPAVWLSALLLAGCAATFSPGAAREISRDRLLAISEKGNTKHLQYMGSDIEYHYIWDSRAGKERSYKIRMNEMKLAATFSVGEDSYVLYPWLIEGQPLGSPPEGISRKPRASTDEEAAEIASRASRAAKPVVERPAQPRVGKRLGDDEVESGGVESP